LPVAKTLTCEKDKTEKATQKGDRQARGIAVSERSVGGWKKLSFKEKGRGVRRTNSLGGGGDNVLGEKTKRSAKSQKQHMRKYVTGRSKGSSPPKRTTPEKLHKKERHLRHRKT